MKPRARRVTIAAAVLGAVVVAILVVTHWGTVREHIEAWHLQLTTETETIEPNPQSPEWLQAVARSDTWLMEGNRLHVGLADRSGWPVIIDPRSLPAFSDSTLVWRREYFTTESILQVLTGRGWHVLEQRFPRRAYIVIRENQREQERRRTLTPSAR